MATVLSPHCSRKEVAIVRWGRTLTLEVRQVKYLYRTWQLWSRCAQRFTGIISYLVLCVFTVMSDSLWPRELYQALPSMGFSRHESWSGLLGPPPRDLPNPGIEPRSPTLQADSLPSSHQGSPSLILVFIKYGDFSWIICLVMQPVCKFWKSMVIVEAAFLAHSSVSATAPSPYVYTFSHPCSVNQRQAVGLELSTLFGL